MPNNAAGDVLRYLSRLPTPEKQHPTRHFLKIFIRKQDYPQNHVFFTCV